MTGLLLDTHIWLWQVRGDDRLPEGLRDSIQRTSNDTWLSPVSLWEVGTLVRRGRITLTAPLRPWVEEALRSFPVREATLNHEVALTSNDIERTVTDPADRLLAATARVYELTLLTVDERLRGLRGVHTRSR